MEDGALLVAVVHVARSAPAGGVVGAWVGLGCVAHRCAGCGCDGGGCGGGGDGVVVDGDGGQVVGGAVAVGAVGVALGGDGGGGAVAGAAAAEGHCLDVAVVGEGFVEGVAGGHCAGGGGGLWCGLFLRVCCVYVLAWGCCGMDCSRLKSEATNKALGFI